MRSLSKNSGSGDRKTWLTSWTSLHLHIEATMFFATWELTLTWWIRSLKIRVMARRREPERDRYHGVLRTGSRLREKYLLPLKLLSAISWSWASWQDVSRNKELKILREVTRHRNSGIRESNSTLGKSVGALVTKIPIFAGIQKSLKEVPLVTKIPVFAGSGSVEF